MERLEGETIGRRIVQTTSCRARRAARADGGRAREDPRDSGGTVSFLPSRGYDRDGWSRARRGRRAASGDRARALVAAREPAAAPRAGRRARRLPHRQPRRRRGRLVGVLDWEFAHLDEPVRDLAFALVRAWRFGVPEKRLGGVAGRAVPRALQRADRASTCSRSSSTTGSSQGTSAGRSAVSRRCSGT